MNRQYGAYLPSHYAAISVIAFGLSVQQAERFMGIAQGSFPTKRMTGWRRWWSECSNVEKHEHLLFTWLHLYHKPEYRSLMRGKVRQVKPLFSREFIAKELNLIGCSAHEITELLL